MKFLALSILSLAVMTGCSQTESKKQSDKTAASAVSNSVAKNVSASEAKELMLRKDIQILDVRTKEETDAGMIQKAVNIDFYAPDFLKRTEVLDKNKPVLVYCAAGGRSAQAMEKMKQAGFKEIYNASGGYKSIK